ncbi:Uncharacterized protein TCAP_00961, partial [Tolypocladium capitatum]
CAAGDIDSSAQSVIDTINIITDLSQQLQGPAGDLSPTDPGAITTVTSGFTRITATITSDITQFAKLQPFDAGCDADAVALALGKFVQAQQTLLTTIIGKAGAFTKVPGAGEPVAAVLTALGGVIDGISKGLIVLVPSDACYTRQQTNSLVNTLNDATAAF